MSKAACIEPLSYFAQNRSTDDIIRLTKIGGAVWIDPDCGLKTRRVDEAKAKLSNIQKAVEAVRKRG